MSRPLFALLAFACFGALSAPAADLPEGKSKRKRVLFRSDAPQLFAPRATQPVPASVPPPRPVATRVSPTARATAAIAPRLPKPRLRQRTTLQTPLVDAPAASEFDIEFHPTNFTPYDRYLGTVRTVFAQLDTRPASMVTACELVRECRGFRYIVTDRYRADPPAVTEARRAGDCKAKALWVYDHLGDPTAYYVIGKLVARSRTSHAWVYWRNNGRWWILDPTARSTPIAADSVSSSRYVPYYSFSRAGAFRHQATRLLLAANGIPASAPVTAVHERAGGTQPAARPTR